MSERALIAVSDELMVEAFVAYRTWSVRVAGGRSFLESRVMDYVWPQGHDAIAWCPHGCVLEDEEIPRIHPACRCGIYAYKSQQQAVRPLAMTTYPIIAGEIYMWGHMIEHKSGWRSSHARVSALYVPIPMRYRDRAELAAHQYNVPLVHVRDDA